MSTEKPLGYLGGDIMSFGSNLARQYEYDEFIKRNINVDVYSPIMNKSINDKAAMTVEENNTAAERIVAADVDRLWNSNFVVMCPEQSAIGSMVEVGILYGWKYLANKFYKLTPREQQEKLKFFLDQDIYCHYFDIRTNHLPEVDWRRSFSINQFLYGCVLAIEKNGDFEELQHIFDQIEDKYGHNVGGEVYNDI